MSEAQHDRLPDELEALKSLLGRGLHQEVKEELKEEAAKPGRLRTKLYATLGVFLIAGVILGMWLMWPARKGEPSLAGTATAAGGRNPISVVKQALDGPESGPWVSVSDRAAIERQRQSMMDDVDVAAFVALDTARKTRREFEAAAKDALTSDAGRHVAASDDLVRRFRLDVESPDLKTARTYLDSPPRTTIPDRMGADNATERYLDAMRKLRVLLAHAAKEQPRATMTLGQAIEMQWDEEAVQKSTAIARAEKKAREEENRKVAAEATEGIRKEEELKRWGVVRPGATWVGTLVVGGTQSPVEIKITARTRDAIEGTLVWTANGRKEGLAFAGTCEGERLSWKTTRRIVGYSGITGSSHIARVSGNELVSSYTAPYQGGEITGTMTATLMPEK